MSAWAYGFDMKNNAGNKLLGGVGIYGNGSSPEHVYLGFGPEPWVSGLKMNSSSIFFKGNKIYHAGDKPTITDIGAASANHNHNNLYQPKESTSFSTQESYIAVRTPGRKANQYYEFWDPDSGWAEIKCKELYVSDGNHKVYHPGNKPSLSELGAAAANHNHDSYYFQKYRADVTDFNNALTEGAYNVVRGSSIPNAPYNGAIYGKLRVYVNDGGTHNNSSNWIWQYFDDTSGNTYFRHKVNDGGWNNWRKLYNSISKPTPSEIGAAPTSHTHDDRYFTKNEINGMISEGNEAGKIVRRNGAGDVVGRLFRATYQDENYIKGALAFRVNNGDDNYTRYCSNTNAIREWISAAHSSHNHSKIIIDDVRGTNPTPNDYNATSISTFFIDTYGDDWRSGITVKGWANPYAVWQISNPASTSAVEGLNFRVGAGNSWGPWRKIYHEGFKPSWNDIQGKPSTFTATQHTHDDLYFRKGLWNTNGGQDLLVHGKRALVGTADGALYLGYGGDFGAIYCCNGQRIYHEGYKPSPGEIGALGRGEKAASASIADTVEWGNVKNRPGSLPPSNPHSFSVSGRNNTGTNTSSDLNTIWKSGFYEINGGNNKPDGTDWHWVIHAGHTSNRSDYKYGMQIAAGNNTNNFYVRTTNQSGNGEWGKIYTTKNKPTPDEIGALGRNEKAVSASNADTVSGKNFVWDWGSGNPTHIWGSSGSATHMQVWSPDSITVGRAKNADSVDWNNIANKPGSFNPAGHTHDDRYVLNYGIRYNGGNANTMTKGGFYAVSVSQPFQNLPVNSDGYIIAIPWNTSDWASQIYINDIQGDMYIRTKTNSGVNDWTDWAKIYDTRNKPTPDEIGAMRSGGQYGTIYLTDWIRTKGQTGLYFQDFGGGWHMTDSIWVRSYQDKNVYTGGTIKAGNMQVGENNVYHQGFKPTPNEIGAANVNHNHSWDNIEGSPIFKMSGSASPPGNSWISNDIKDNPILLGGNFDRPGNIIFSSYGGENTNMVVDGTYFAENGQRRVQLEPQKTPLWQGCTYLNKGQNFKVNKPLSKCQNGWILVFSDYDPGGNPNGNDFNFCTHIVHKNSLIVNKGNVLFSIPNSESGGWTIKAAYIKDNEIQGQSVETVAGWNDVVLRQILEF